MSDVVLVPKGEIEGSIGKYGAAIAGFGAVLILLDGFYALVSGSVLVPTLGNANVVAWVEMLFAMIAIIFLYNYGDFPNATASVVGSVAVLTYAFDGGFYFIGSTLALIGAVLIYYRK